MPDSSGLLQAKTALLPFSKYRPGFLNPSPLTISLCFYLKHIIQSTLNMLTLIMNPSLYVVIVKYEGMKYLLYGWMVLMQLHGNTWSHLEPD